MEIRKLIAAGAAAITFFAAGAANAALVFAGSWRLTDGPVGSTSPLSAQQAAAQLFGGDAADYSISIAGDDVGDINNQAWYLIFDMPGSVFVGGESATDFFGFGISAYAFDAELAKDANSFVNYAFRETDVVGPGIPEPATWGLLIGGFGLTGAALRRRRSVAA
jgi:hypothetical protein